MAFCRAGFLLYYKYISMKRMTFLPVAVAAGLGLWLTSGCSKSPEPGSSGAAGVEKPTLKFSAIPDQNKTNLEKFNVVASYLAKELGIRVEYVPSPDYGTSVTNFKNKDIQLAWFGGLTGVQAREAVPGATAIAQGDTDPKFIAYVIAHKDSGLAMSENFPMALGDMDFTFGAPDSTSGRLMPQYFIEQATGKPVADFFKKGLNYGKDHDGTAESVQSGKFMAGVLNSSVFDKRVKEGKTDPNVVSVVWKTPPFQDYNWTAHPVLEKTYGEGFTLKLQRALIDMTTKAPELLAVFPRKAMIPAKNEDYATIREVAIKSGLLRTK